MFGPEVWTPQLDLSKSIWSSKTTDSNRHRLTFVSTQHDHPILMTNGSLGVTKWVCRMKHISEIIQLEALVIRIVCVWCVDTNEPWNMNYQTSTIMLSLSGYVEF
jgi:hypothetical protein